MKIIYDSISADYVYPLSKTDVVKVGRHVPPEIWATIQSIRFGFSGNSTHAGRMVKQGSSYRIRVNFCPKREDGGLRSPIVCRQERYLRGVLSCGGKPDADGKTILWDSHSAERYAFHVLTHEIGHVAYAEKGLCGSPSVRGTSGEEDWCDDYSVRLMQKIQGEW